MAWDFETEPEFEAKLEWIRQFVADRIEPLDLIYPGRAFHPLDDETGPLVRPMQEEIRALGRVDVLLIPVGGYYTIGPDEAAQVVDQLKPRVVVPMHYRTPAVNFLDLPDSFLAALDARVSRFGASDFRAEAALGTRGEPTVALPAVPT